MEKFKYKFDDLFNPTIMALHELGGSGSNSEIEDKVAGLMNLTEDEINEIHRGNRTKFSYRLAWTKNYLKRAGLFENSNRGVWALTEDGKKTKKVNKSNIKQKVKKLDNKKDKQIFREDIDNGIEGEIDDIDWEDELLELIKRIKPDQFERLCQRLLRELGFDNVEVLGRTNDGGIDGKGLLKLGGVLSFHVVFQAKRYSGSVSSNIIRDFRGAMIGRADKGLIISTGTFTREARKEAQRDGAPPIDLVDGPDLATMLKQLNLGVKIEIVEQVVIMKEWFKNL